MASESRLGGLIKPDVVSLSKIESQISVNWTWNNPDKGIVQWTFTNGGTGRQSVILLRNGYYFGNAFWPIYVGNPNFDVAFTSNLDPLVDRGLNSNSAPTAVIRFPEGRMIVCFVFTLNPGQTWSMLEGGFDKATNSQPDGVSVHPITFSEQAEVCIGYDPKQVSDWDLQTNTSYKGFSPNPRAFETVVCDVSAQYIALFNDPISIGTCDLVSGVASGCQAYVNAAQADLAQGKVMDAMDNIANAVQCALSGKTPKIKRGKKQPKVKKLKAPKEKKRRFRRNKDTE